MTRGDTVVGYVRVSTSEQETNGAGLDAQRAAIERECAHRGWQLLRIEQDVASGKTTKRRGGLERALAVCKSGEATAVVVAKLDRLSRSMLDFAQVLERARREGWSVVALDVAVDTTTASGEMIANVLASLAQWERRLISERTRAALQVKRAQGVRLGRPEQIDAALRRRIVRMRRKGSGLSAIAAVLNDEGVPTARGGVRWYPSTVRAVLAAEAAL